MAAPETQSSDVLTVEERFFLHIALKNGLLDPAQGDRAVRACVERGLGLEEVVRGLGLLSEARIKQVREAMAASQVVRLDTLFAQVALARGLVARAAVEQAFAEQRRQRYRVRIGALLVERGQLAQAAHHAVISEVIRRLREEGAGAYSSTVERRGAAVEESALGRAASETGPVARPPHPPPLASGSTEALLLPQAEPPRAPARGWSEDDGVLGLDGLGGDDSPDPDEGDDLLRSAIRIGMSSNDHSGVFRRSDEEALERDLLLASRSVDPDGSDPGGPAARGAVARDRPGETQEAPAPRASPQGSFVLDREALAQEQGFEPELWAARRRRRLRLLQVGGAAAALVALGAFLLVVATILGNRKRLERVRAQLAAAEAAADPAERARLAAATLAALEATGDLGVNDDVRRFLLEQARWRALEAEALGLLAADRPEDARALLEARRPASPPSVAPELEGLLRRCERELQLELGRAAEARQDWEAAVAAYRTARDLGDPGSVARGRLDAVRAELARRLEEALARARETLATADEEAFAAAAKRFTELFNDPGAAEPLAELRYRRALAGAAAALDQDDLALAQARLDEARGLRPRDQAAAPLADRLARRREQRAEERRGREAEQRGDFEQAAEFYRRAREVAPEADRPGLEATIARCREAIARRDAQRARRALIEQALDHLRGSRIADAVAALEQAAREGQDPRTKAVLDLARRLDGMVYVAPGPFLMGSRDDDPRARPIERPQRRVELPGYFIDATEVTNEAYARFVAATGATPPRHWTYAGRGPGGAVVRDAYDPVMARHPVVNVSWADAQAYARWRGGRLPSEAEWEKAARGVDGRAWPWGDEARASAHVSRSAPRTGPATAPVGAHRDDTSPCGARDMAGNVHEWTGDVFAPYPGAPPDARAKAGTRVLRGGAWRWPVDDARCAARDGADEGYAHETVGFRVVVEVPPEIRPLHVRQGD